ncbi:hypothetical protein PENTCL1PPCAC_29889, partial [Pristionchus entomophagus]
LQMGYLIAVDTSLSMGLAPDGGKKKMINGMIEKTRFEIAADIVEVLLQMARRLNIEPAVHLFRIGETYVNLGEVSSVEDVACMLTKDDGKNVELFGCTNMSRFMAFTHERLNPSIEDKMIILTDCSTFEGDVNYAVGCETRFIIVNSNKQTMSEMQLEELDEIAASSVGYEAHPENEPLYHHFFLADFPSVHELSTSVFEEMFEMSTYTLEMGHMTTQMRIGHSFYHRGVELINVLGFLRPTALMNMDTTGTHFCHPVFYKDPMAHTETTSSEVGEPMEKDDSEDEENASGTDADTEPEYTEVEEEVTDDEEEGELKEPRPSFIPTKALSKPEDKRRIDIGGIIASTSKATEEPVLPDFVPPSSEASGSSAPKRKYKVISKGGVEKEYVAGSRAEAVPPPAYEPLEEEKPASKKKTVTPPPNKKTKRIKRKVKRTKKETILERHQRLQAAKARQEFIRMFHAANSKKEGDEQRKEHKTREEYNRDDVALVIEAKDEGEDSEDCWSVKEGEFSDTETLKRVREEIKEEEENNGEKKDVEMEKKEEEEKLTTPFQSSKSRKRKRLAPVEFDYTAPYLVQLLTEAMRQEDMNAVCLMDNGQYAILSVDQNSDGDDLLVISSIVDQEIMPTMIPQFAQLTTTFDESNDVDNLYLTQPVGIDNPSYVSARSSWFNEDGIEAEMVRIRKNLKKIPERLPHFYLDVNRMRQHAYCVCYQNYLPEIADQLIGEAKDFGEAAVKHAEYVAVFFRKIVPYSEVKEIVMPNF